MSDGPSSFTSSDVLREGSLASALTQLVLRSPELEIARKNAQAFASLNNLPFENDAGLLGSCYGSEEAVLPLRYFKLRDWDENLVESPPTDDQRDFQDLNNQYFRGEGDLNVVDDFYDAIMLRADTLFLLLQRKQVIGWGTTADGELVPLAHTIWSHPDYYVHPSTGDIYDGSTVPMTRRWSGVLFSPPGQHPFATTQHNGIAGNPSEPKSNDFEEARLIPSKALAAAASNIRLYQDCLDWLMELMRTSPKRPVVNAELWNKARTRWPLLSHAQFKIAKAQAVQATGAIDWVKAGAPKRIG
jgi:hypothetical protein